MAVARTIFAAASAAYVYFIYIVYAEMDPRVARWLAHEDGIVESASALLYLCAFIVCVYFSFKTQGTRRLYCAVWGLLCFLFFGEETSWLQRLADADTPEFFLKYNFQDEVNLHNMVWVTPKPVHRISDLMTAQGAFYMLMFVNFFVLPIAVRARLIPARLREALDFPAPDIVTLASIWAVVAWSFLILAVGGIPENRGALTEIRETYLALAIFVYVLILAFGGDRVVETPGSRRFEEFEASPGSG